MSVDPAVLEALNRLGRAQLACLDDYGVVVRNSCIEQCSDERDWCPNCLENIEAARMLVATSAPEGFRYLARRVAESQSDPAAPFWTSPRSSVVSGGSTRLIIFWPGYGARTWPDDFNSAEQSIMREEFHKLGLPLP